MKTNTQRYTNRYGDVYLFTRLEDGSILWEGKFEYCRIGIPNNYNKAFAEYIKDKGTLTLVEFKEKIYSYDSELREYKYRYLDKYRNLIVPDKDKIDMVDPSGGPYIATGMEWMDSIIKEIVPHGDGFKLVVE